MYQYEAVISVLEALGGKATLAQLYRSTLEVSGVKWGTKTPYASIRRIVQARPEIFKIRPGLWALESHRERLGLDQRAGQAANSADSHEESHSYYQGLLTVIGNLRGYATFVPNQDKNRLCLRKRLEQIRTLDDVPPFAYPEMTRRIGSVDVTWFNDRMMPHSLFEVEHTTNIQNSLLKFSELQDFNVRMVIVADGARKRNYESKVKQRAFREIAERVSFYDYESLARDYEHEAVKRSAGFSL